MKKLFATFFLLLLCNGANAQYIIDLSCLDYIDTDEERLEGYSKNGNGYIFHSFDRYELSTDSLIISQTEEDSIYNDVMKVSDIPALSIADWEDLLDKHDIVWEENDKGETTLMIKKSPYYMLGIKLSYSDETAKYKDDNGKLQYGKISVGNRKYNVLDCTDQYSINYIKLKGNKYLLCLTNDSYTYKFMPHKGKRGAKMSSGKLEKELEKNRIEMYSPVREYAMFDIDKTVNGKYAIINNMDMPMGIEGDTIIGRNSPVAVYHKAENRYDLYDPFLNKVKHSYNIRYIKPDNQNWLTLLVGNKLKWLTNRGIKDNPIRTLKALMVCGTVSRYIDDIKYAEGKIKLEKIKDHTMTGYNIEYFSYDITNAQEIDSLYFDRGKIQLRYSANDYPSFRRARTGNITKDKLLYAKKKNGKYNLYTYREISSELYKQTEAAHASPMDIELGNGKPAKRYSKGEIELIQLLVADADSITMNLYPIVYTQNGLEGIYGINPKARYAALDNFQVDLGLVRYLLPDGRQGWLDLDSGEELEDI